MKKTQKQVLGFLGLAGVAAMTAAAAAIPVPGAAAVGTTDTIQVRVVDSTNPSIVAETDEEKQVTDPYYDFTVKYSNIRTITTKIINRNASGEVTSETVIWNENVSGVTDGAKDFNLNLDDYGGVGYYTILTTGITHDGLETEQILTVTYTNVDADVVIDEDSSDVEIEVEPGDDVEKVEVNVYDKDGNLVDTIVIENTGGKIDITVPMEGYETGEYTIEIVYRDADGNVVGVPYTVQVSYNAEEEEVVPVPDTGALLQELNISREDYLATGLIVFFVFAVVAFGIVARNRNSKKSNAKR